MEIPMDERKEQSALIVEALALRVAGMNPFDKVRLVYNQAVADVLKAIGKYADENPMHRLAFESLKETLDGWMPLI